MRRSAERHPRFRALQRRDRRREARIPVAIAYDDRFVDPHDMVGMDPGRLVPVAGPPMQHLMPIRVPYGCRKVRA